MADDKVNPSVGALSFCETPCSRKLAFKLSTLLDVEHPMGRDGKQFLEEFGYLYEEIRFLYDRFPRPVVVCLLENHVGERSLMEIVGVLKKMEREDCINTVRKIIVDSAIENVDVDADIDTVLSWSADVLPRSRESILTSIPNDQSTTDAGQEMPSSQACETSKDETSKEEKPKMTAKQDKPPAKKSFKVKWSMTSETPKQDQQSKTSESSKQKDETENEESVMLEYEPFLNKKNEVVKVVLENGYTDNDAIPSSGEKSAEAGSENAEDFDPWALPPEPTAVNWNELSSGQRFQHLTWSIGKLLCLVFLLYIFICSLDLIALSFHLIGGNTVRSLLKNGADNSVMALMIGVLTSAILPSSSLIASAMSIYTVTGMLSISNAVLVIMGSTIGMCLTTTTVAFFRLCNRTEFSRIFGGATLSYTISVITLLILFPLESLFGALSGLSHSMFKTMDFGSEVCIIPGRSLWPDISKAFTEKIIQSNCSMLNEIAKNSSHDSRLLAIQCLPANGTAREFYQANTVEFDLFQGWTCEYKVLGILTVNGGLFGAAILGITWLFTALIMALISRLIRDRSRVVNRICNYGRCLTGLLCIIIGAGVTVLLQSSVKFIIIMLQLFLRANQVDLFQVYPSIVGAYIGEAILSILHATSHSGSSVPMQLAMCHLVMCIINFIIWFFMPCIRNNILLHGWAMGERVYKYPWIAPIYILGLLILLPSLAFGLAKAGWLYLSIIGIPVFISVAVIYTINILQKKAPGILPKKLQTWEFLPVWMHSLKAFDNGIRHICRKSCEDEQRTNPPNSSTDTTN